MGQDLEFLGTFGIRKFELILKTARILIGTYAGYIFLTSFMKMRTGRAQPGWGTILESADYPEIPARTKILSGRDRTWIRGTKST